MKASALLACTALWLLAVAPDSSADAFFLPSRAATTRPVVRSFRVLVTTNGKTADFFLQAEASSLREDVAWIVPVPAGGRCKLLKEPAFSKDVAALRDRLRRDMWRNDLSVYKKLMRSKNPPFWAKPQKPEPVVLPDERALVPTGKDVTLVKTASSLKAWASEKGFQIAPEDVALAQAHFDAGFELAMVRLGVEKKEGFTPVAHVQSPTPPKGLPITFLGRGHGLRSVEVVALGLEPFRHPLLELGNETFADAKGNTRTLTVAKPLQMACMRTVRKNAEGFPNRKAEYSRLTATLPACFFAKEPPAAAWTGPAGVKTDTWWFDRCKAACASPSLPTVDWTVRQLNRRWVRHGKRRADLDAHVDTFVPAVLRLLGAARFFSHDEVFPAISFLSSGYVSGRGRSLRTVPHKYYSDINRLAKRCAERATHGGVVSRARGLVARTGG